MITVVKKIVQGYWSCTMDAVELFISY